MKCTADEYHAIGQLYHNRPLSIGLSPATWLTSQALAQAPARTAPTPGNSYESAARLKWLEQEPDNVREAFRWALANHEAEFSLRLADAMWWFWWLRGVWTHGREWLEKALQIAPAPSLARAKALLGAIALANRQGNDKVARCWLEESAALYRQFGDQQGLGDALGHIGTAQLGIYRAAARGLSPGAAPLSRVPAGRSPGRTQARSGQWVGRLFGAVKAACETMRGKPQGDKADPRAICTTFCTGFGSQNARATDQNVIYWCIQEHEDHEQQLKLPA